MNIKLIKKMGKKLHYSIRPFIENAIKNHHNVEKIEEIELDDFYAYKITRKKKMSDVIVVLSDDYYFGEISIQEKPAILKNGGFFLKARPEGGGIDISIPAEKLGLGGIKKLLGALNRSDFWNYELPLKKN